LDRAFRNQIAKLKKLGYLADTEESVYNGRRVLAVMSERKREVKGLVQGSSETGKTAFIEPLETVDLNNEVFELEAMEKREIIRILRELTAQLRNHRTLIQAYQDVLVEMDHDDYLTPDAVDLMVEAFQKYPDCKFVYSDFAEIDENHNSLTYGDSFSFNYGSYRDEEYNGRVYKTVNTSGINPKTIRHIVGVPNHFRAWRRDHYHAIGGHNRGLTIADDYELVVRSFLTSRFVRIPKCCYIQYYYGQNTQDSNGGATRRDIQRRVRTIAHHYNEAIKARFEELGMHDWAYEYHPQDPLWAPSQMDAPDAAYTLKL
jgi:hypothetical protein